MKQASTHPNKAFWEAVALVALLLLILLLSVLHLSGWLRGGGGSNDSDERDSLGRGSREEDDDSDSDDRPREPKDLRGRGDGGGEGETPRTAPAPDTPKSEPDSGKDKKDRPTPKDRPDPPSSASSNSSDDGGDEGGGGLPGRGGGDGGRGRGRVLKPGMNARLRFANNHNVNLNFGDREGIDVEVRQFDREEDGSLTPVTPEPTEGTTTRAPHSLRTQFAALSPITVMSARTPATSAPWVRNEEYVPLSAAPARERINYERWEVEEEPLSVEGLSEREKELENAPSLLDRILGRTGRPGEKLPPELKAGLDPLVVDPAMVDVKADENASQTRNLSPVLPPKNAKDVKKESATKNEAEILQKARQAAEADRKAAQEEMMKVHEQMMKEWNQLQVEMEKRLEADQKRSEKAENDAREKRLEADQKRSEKAENDAREKEERGKAQLKDKEKAKGKDCEATDEKARGKAKAEQEKKKVEKDDSPPEKEKKEKTVKSQKEVDAPSKPKEKKAREKSKVAVSESESEEGVKEEGKEKVKSKKKKKEKAEEEEDEGFKRKEKKEKEKDKKEKDKEKPKNKKKEAHGEESEEEAIEEEDEQGKTKKAKKTKVKEEKEEAKRTKSDKEETMKVNISEEDAEILRDRLDQLERSREREPQQSVVKEKKGDKVKGKKNKDKGRRLGRTGDPEEVFDEEISDEPAVPTSKRRKEKGDRDELAPQKKERVMRNERDRDDDDWEDRHGAGRRVGDSSDYVRETASRLRRPEADDGGSYEPDRRRRDERPETVNREGSQRPQRDSDKDRTVAADDEPDEVLGKKADPKTVKKKRQAFLDRVENGDDEGDGIQQSNNDAELGTSKNRSLWSNQQDYKHGIKEIQAEIEQQSRANRLRKGQTARELEAEVSSKPSKKNKKALRLSGPPPEFEEMELGTIGAEDLEDEEEPELQELPAGPVARRSRSNKSSDETEEVSWSPPPTPDSVKLRRAEAEAELSVPQWTLRDDLCYCKDCYNGACEDLEDRQDRRAAFRTRKKSVAHTLLDDGCACDDCIDEVEELCNQLDAGLREGKGQSACTRNGGGKPRRQNERESRRVKSGGKARTVIPLGEKPKPTDVTDGATSESSSVPVGTASQDSATPSTRSRAGAEPAGVAAAPVMKSAKQDESPASGQNTPVGDRNADPEHGRLSPHRVPTQTEEERPVPRTSEPETLTPQSHEVYEGRILVSEINEKNQEESRLRSDRGDGRSEEQPVQIGVPFQEEMGRPKPRRPDMIAKRLEEQAKSTEQPEEGSSPVSPYSPGNMRDTSPLHQMNGTSENSPIHNGIPFQGEIIRPRPKRPDVLATRLEEQVKSTEKPEEVSSPGGCANYCADCDLTAVSPLGPAYMRHADIPPEQGDIYELSGGYEDSLKPTKPASGTQEAVELSADAGVPSRKMSSAGVRPPSLVLKDPSNANTTDRRQSPVTKPRGPVFDDIHWVQGRSNDYSDEEVSPGRGRVSLQKTSKPSPPPRRDTERNTEISRQPGRSSPDPTQPFHSEFELESDYSDPKLAPPEQARYGTNRRRASVVLSPTNRIQSAVASPAWPSDMEDSPVRSETRRAPSPRARSPVKEGPIVPPARDRTDTPISPARTAQVRVMQNMRPSRYDETAAVAVAPIRGAPEKGGRRSSTDSGYGTMTENEQVRLEAGAQPTDRSRKATRSDGEPEQKNDVASPKLRGFETPSAPRTPTRSSSPDVQPQTLPWVPVSDGDVEESKPSRRTVPEEEAGVQAAEPEKGPSAKKAEKKKKKKTRDNETPEEREGRKARRAERRQKIQNQVVDDDDVEQTIEGERKLVNSGSEGDNEREGRRKKDKRKKKAKKAKGTAVVDDRRDGVSGDDTAEDRATSPVPAPRSPVRPEPTVTVDDDGYQSMESVQMSRVIPGLRDSSPGALASPMAGDRQDRANRRNGAPTSPAFIRRPSRADSVIPVSPTRDATQQPKQAEPAVGNQTPKRPPKDDRDSFDGVMRHQARNTPAPLETDLQNAKYARRYAEAKQKAQSSAGGDTASTSFRRSFLRAPQYLFRSAAHVVRHSPVFSVLLLGILALWIEGTRQIANLMILSSGSSANAPIISKRALGTDLDFTTSLAQAFLGKKTLDPSALFVLINIFTVGCICLALLFFHLAISYADVDKKSNITDRAEQILSKLLSPVLMGAAPHYPWTWMKKAGWRTCLRIFLFALQIVLTALILHQAMAFVFLVNDQGAVLTFVGDTNSTQPKLADAAKSVTPQTAFIALFLLLGVSIMTLLAGWYGLLNPRAAPLSAKSNTLAKIKGNATMIQLFKVIGAIVIFVTFIGLMYFFSEISAYTADSALALPTGTYNTNLVLANGILFIFTPALAWGLMTIWNISRKAKPSGSSGNNTWVCGLV